VQPEPPFFLYDGECGFCIKWMRWLQRRIDHDLAFVASQDVDDLGRFGLSDADVATASYWVDERGRPHRGSRSFTGVLRHGGRGWRLVAALLDLPVVRTLAGWAYTVIARNRHRLPAPD